MYAGDLGTGANTSDDVNYSVELFQKGGVYSTKQSKLGHEFG